MDILDFKPDIKELKGYAKFQRIDYEDIWVINLKPKKNKKSNRNKIVTILNRIIEDAEETGYIVNLPKIEKEYYTRTYGAKLFFPYNQEENLGLSLYFHSILFKTGREQIRFNISEHDYLDGADWHVYKRKMKLKAIEEIENL